MSHIKYHLTEFQAKTLWSLLKDCLLNDKEGLDSGSGGLFYNQERMAVMEVLSILAKGLDNFTDTK